MTRAIRVVRRRFPLRRTYRTASGSIGVREVAVVGLFEDGVLVGVGEASPLPGYSDESLDASVAAILGFDASRLVSAIDDLDFDAARESTSTLPPSARSAIEVAVLDAMSRRARVSLATFLGAPPDATSAPARLVDFAALELGATLSGANAYKIKVGRDLAAELDLVARLRSYDPAAEIRLDANRSLDPDRDREFLARLREHRIAFLEEPFADLASTLALQGIPVALDESLRGVDPDRVESLLDGTGVVALVLKPTTLGFLHALALRERVTRRNLRAVVSHAFEGPVGYSALAAFALASDEPSPGLDADYGPVDESVVPIALSLGRLEADESPGLGPLDAVARWF